MPNRIIKESICYSDDLDQLSAFEETVFFRLLVNVDDYGRIDARPQFLKSKLFVTKKGITDKNIGDAVSKLALVGLVRLYNVDGKPFLLFPKWDKHQRIRNSKERYPAPTSDDDLQEFAASCGELRPESNPNPNPNPNPEDIGGKPPKKARPRFVPPLIDEVRAYCIERGNSVDPQRFFDYFTESDWVDSKGNPVKNWKQKIITWEGNNGTNSNNTPKLSAGNTSEAKPKYGTVL